MNLVSGNVDEKQFLKDNINGKILVSMAAMQPYFRHNLPNVYWNREGKFTFPSRCTN